MSPMDPEIRRQFRALFDAHDEAVRALDAATERMRESLRAQGDVLVAHDEATQGALAANRAAIDLLERLSGNGQ